MSLGDIWGASDKPGPSKLVQQINEAHEQKLVRTIEQAAWSWLVDTVEIAYSNLLNGGGNYSKQEASKLLREFLGVKILVWQAIMNKYVIIPDEFRVQVLEVKDKMKEWRR